MANDLRKTVKDQLTAKVFTQSELAKSIGMSVGAVSAWLKGTYMGRNDTLETLVAEFLNRRTATHREISMLKRDFDFVPTENYELASDGIDVAEARGEFRLMIGISGIGKTMALNRIHENKRTSVLIRAYRGITTRGYMTRFCKELGLEPRYSFGRMFEDIVAEMKGTGRLVMVDEAEHLPIEAMDAMRTFSDFTGCSVILCGLPMLLNMLRSSTKYTYIYNRTSLNISLGALREADVERMVATMVDSPVEAAFWLKACRGIGRDLKMIVQESLRLADKKQIDVQAEPERFKTVINGVVNLLGRNPQAV